MYPMMMFVHGQIYTKTGRRPVSTIKNDMTTDSFPLTAIHLVYTCKAFDAIRLHPYKAGGQLRGAFAQVLLRVACPNHGQCPSEAQCPACTLLREETHGGEQRRPYALNPPIFEANEGGQIAAGQLFRFGITLFGDGLRYLPYLIVPWHGAGELGVGLHGNAGRGRFGLCEIVSLNPFSGDVECVLAEGEQVVRMPERQIDHTQLLAMQPIEGVGTAVLPRNQRLHVSFALHFRTPMRIISNQEVLRVPHFGTLFKTLLKRLDDLAKQYADPQFRRPREQIDLLEAAANRVLLQTTHTEWIDLFSGSSRTHSRTPVGGFVGYAQYSASLADWQLLRPWLHWGELVQVGKNTVKGDGVFRIEN